MYLPLWLRRLLYSLVPPPSVTVHHVVKTWPMSFSEIREGIKTFEARFDDRGYAVGHVIRSEEWLQHPGKYTQRWELVEVTHMIRDEERDYKPQLVLQKGWVIMSIRRLGFNEENAKDFKMHTLAQPPSK